MTLAKRLNDMERRIKALEEWKGTVEAAIEAEEADDQPEPERTLDGEQVGGERDQNQAL